MKIHKKPDSKIVLISGCFDGGIHRGHQYILQHAYNLAPEEHSRLIVLLNSDEYIRKNKGPNRPVNKLSERIKQVDNLSLADTIISFEDNTELLNIIKTYQPDYIVVGSDYSDINKVVGYPECLSWGGQVKVIERIKDGKGIDISTTNILKNE